MTTIAAQLEKEFPQRNANWSVTLVPVHEQMVDQIRPALLVLAGAVLLVFSLRASTSPTCCWRAARFVSVSLVSARRSAPAAAVCCDRC